MTYVVPSPVGAVEVEYRPGEVEARTEGVDHRLLWRAFKNDVRMRDYERAHSQEDAEWFAQSFVRSLEEDPS